MTRATKTGIVVGVVLAVSVALAVRAVGTAAAIALAASVQFVSRWVAGRTGARSIAAFRSVAGVSLLLGGANFVWTAM